jgi:hypothetical protein
LRSSKLSSSNEDESQLNDSDLDISSDDEEYSSEDESYPSTRMNILWGKLDEQRLLAWKKEGKPWDWNFYSFTLPILTPATSKMGDSYMCLRFPNNCMTHVERPLGFIRGEGTTSLQTRPVCDTSLAHERLTFLDRRGWLCSVPLNTVNEGADITRHFFLPQEWLNPESLELAGVTGEGTLLCPKDGEVGLVYNGLRASWLGEI